MANRCASLDHAWSHHLPVAPASPSLWPHAGAAWFCPAATAFENDGLASALVRASVSPSSPTPSTSTVSSSTSELSCIPHDALAPAPAQLGCRPGPVRSQTLRPCTGRVSKRKPRASRRAQTTYISAEPADFRRMVQEITGFQVPGAEPDSAAGSASAPTRPSQLAFVLPTLDTSAFFSIDRAPVPLPPRWEEDKTPGRAARAAMGAAAEAGAGAGADDASLLLMRELEAMVSAPAAVPSSFPTLESWGMI